MDVTLTYGVMRPYPPRCLDGGPAGAWSASESPIVLGAALFVTLFIVPVTATFAGERLL